MVYDNELVTAVLGAAVGALLFLWTFGVWGAIPGAIIGAVGLSKILSRRL